MWQVTQIVPAGQIVLVWHLDQIILVGQIGQIILVGQIVLVGIRWIIFVGQIRLMRQISLEVLDRSCGSDRFGQH